MTWQDDFENCSDPEIIMEICAKDRDMCIEHYDAEKCEMVLTYIPSVAHGDMCFNENACAIEINTGNSCTCQDSKWSCGVDIICEEK